MTTWTSLTVVLAVVFGPAWSVLREPAGGTAQHESAPVAAVAAAPGDVGWEGPSFQGASGSPSGSKPESKLWFNDGRWWATLFDSASGDFFIHYLDVAGQTWVKTPSQIDDRSNSRADVLWNGSQLFVASHRFSNSSNSDGNPAELSRYSYSPLCGTYALDAGFPVAINDVRTETLVIDQDSTGRLWATWRESDRVYVAYSTPGGGSWSTPAPLPVAGADVSSDDISSVVAFGGDRIGIMWSNQSDDAMYFSVHLDSDPPGTWSTPEVAFSGSNSADDHINLKSVQDENGRILAAVKTSGSSSSVLVHLLDRDFSTGTWTSHPFGLGSDNHTRPIVAVDRTADEVHLFATSDQSGGSIYEKTAPLANISFAPGKGTAVLTDASSDDINNPTSTKQNVTADTGLVVLATNDTTREYWTHYDDLDGSGVPTDVGDVDRDGIGDACDPTDDRAVLTPGGKLVQEGDGADTIVQVPVRIDAPTDTDVTAHFQTASLGPGTGLADSGTDYAATSGTVTIPAGDTVGYYEVVIHGDLEDEPPLLWGEWLLINFDQLSTNARLDTDTFFGAGLVVIADDD